MANQVYIGVDLGAEAGSVSAGLWDGRRIQVEELVRFANGPVTVGGTLRWNVLGLWTKIKEGLAAAARKYGQAVVSVGVDTWGVDHVLLSANSEMLGLPYHYRDARTRGLLESTFKQVPRSEIFAVTGLQFMEINTLYQLLAMRRRNPELFWIADRFLLMPDFFHWCLTGVKVTEFTNATTTQCFNARERKWAVDLLNRLDLPTRMFPEVAAPGTRLGRLQEELAKITGLGRIAVVAPATHDTASAVAAVPARQTGRGNWAYVSSGTWSLVGVELAEALISEQVLEANLTNEGGIDHTYRLLKNIMGLWLEHQCRLAFEEKGLGVNSARLARLAAEAPPFRSLVNPDDPRFLNPTDMPAAIQDFCRESGQPVPETEGQILRCVYESLALAYAATIGALETLTGNRIELIHVLRGGAKNDLMNRFTANACARPVLAGPRAASVLGNVLVQARVAGEIQSLEQMRAVVRDSCELRDFDPETGGADLWTQARSRFKELLERPPNPSAPEGQEAPIDWRRLAGDL